jgi:tetratricopeptide (TPR) repeat protein
MKKLTVIFLLLVLFAFPMSALADVAPPYNPPGSNVEPGSETTQVRMVAETVVISVRSDITPGSLGSARVTADFKMHNTGSQAENLAVRFPISSDDGRGAFPELSDLGVKVEGSQIPFRRVNYPDVRYGNDNVPWAEFDINFPAGQDVNIEVAYDLNGSGYYPFTAFYYILHTGAGWKDTIGSADIILRMPYPANVQNVIMNFEIGWAETTGGGVFQGNEVRWHFENFEPGDGPVQDMEFALVAPAVWSSVVTEQKNVAKNPNDGEAWGRLAKAYKESYFPTKGYRTDKGGIQVYQASLDAYQKCLTLLPDDAQWHAGYADLLASRAYWDQPVNSISDDALHALEEMRTALQLAPNDPKVLQVAENISYMFPDEMTKNDSGGYTFHGLPEATATPLSNPLAAPTQTETLIPAATATSPATETPAPQATATPLSQPTSTPPVTSTPQPTVPESKPASPLCGTAGLIPLAAIIWLKRKSSKLK